MHSVTTKARKGKNTDHLYNASPKIICSGSSTTASANVIEIKALALRRASGTPAVVSLIPGSSGGSLILDFAPRTWSNWQTPHQLNASVAAAAAASDSPASIIRPRCGARQPIPGRPGDKTAVRRRGLSTRPRTRLDVVAFTGDRAVKQRKALTAACPPAAVSDRKCDAFAIVPLLCVCVRVCAAVLSRRNRGWPVEPRRRQSPAGP
jgi:hypothetical protein